MINTVGFQRSVRRQEIVLNCTRAHTRSEAQDDRQREKEKGRLNYRSAAVLRVFKYATLQVIMLYSFALFRQ